MVGPDDARVFLHHLIWLRAVHPGEAARILARHAAGVIASARASTIRAGACRRGIVTVVRPAPIAATANDLNQSAAGGNGVSDLGDHASESQKPHEKRHIFCKSRHKKFLRRYGSLKSMETPRYTGSLRRTQQRVPCLSGIDHREPQMGKIKSNSMQIWRFRFDPFANHVHA